MIASSSGRGPRRRRGRATGLAIGLVLLFSLAGAAGATAAPWGYEQVTPVNKGGGAVSYVDTFQAAPDGESILYTTNSPFDSIPSESSPLYTRYLGWRGPDKWNNVPLDPPFENGKGSGAMFDIAGVIGNSSNLRYAVVVSSFALTPGATEGGGNIYLRDTRTRELTLIATSPYRALSNQMQSTLGELSVMYVDNDGKSVLFGTGVPLLPGVPAAQPPNFTEFAASYKWTPEKGLEAVTVLPESEGGEVVAGYPGGYPGETGTRNGIPETGGADHVYWSFFTINGPEGIYVRTGDETKGVSYSRLPGAPTKPVPAEIDGISRNGEYMVFQTRPYSSASSQLTEDTPEGLSGEFGPLANIYRYRFSDDSLDYVGTTQSFGTAGVIQMSQDGQTIAYQSNLAQAEGAVEGKPNTYIWRNGERQFVATVEPASGAAGIPSSRQMLSANGRYFTFTADAKGLAEKFDQDDISAACPIPSTTEPGTNEPGPCEAVYVYDSEATGDPLQCASCRAPGVPPKGPAGDVINHNTGYMRINDHITQSVADDGTVFFTTLDGLLPEDRNELEDVYAYRDGNLRLVSRAKPGYSSRFLEATPDGKTVFFATNDPISPLDNDQAVDIYMTREGAGYPYSPPPVKVPCDGVEACHAGVPGIPSQSSAGTASFQGRGNEVPGKRAGTVTVVKPKIAVGSTGVLKVKAPGKGKLTVTGPGVKKATRSVAKAGTYAVKVTLTSAAGKALKKAGSAQKRLKVTFKPSQGKASSTTVKLAFKAPAGKKGGR